MEWVYSEEEREMKRRREKESREGAGRWREREREEINKSDTEPTYPGTYLIFEESISSCFEEKLCGRYISSLSREEES